MRYVTLRWPFLAAIGFSLGVPFLYSLYRTFVGLPDGFGLDIVHLFLVSNAYPGAAILLAAVLLLKGSGRRHVAEVVLIVAMPVLLVMAPFARAAVLRSGEYVHLATTVLLTRADRPEGGGHPRMTWVHWHTGHYAWTPPGLELLVLDESNGLALPAAERSEAWHRLASDTYTAATAHAPASSLYDARILDRPFQAHHLLGHYYVVEISL